MLGIATWVDHQARWLYCGWAQWRQKWFCFYSEEPTYLQNTVACRFICGIWGTPRKRAFRRGFQPLFYYIQKQFLYLLVAMCSFRPEICCQTLEIQYKWQILCSNNGTLLAFNLQKSSLLLLRASIRYRQWHASARCYWNTYRHYRRTLEWITSDSTKGAIVRHVVTWNSRRHGLSLVGIAVFTGLSILTHLLEKKFSCMNSKEAPKEEHLFVALNSW